MTNKLELPENPKLAGQVLQQHADATARDMERGWIGRFFGMAKEKPQNAAIFAFIVSALMFGLIYFVPAVDASQKSAAMGLIGSVFTGSIGYLFGGAGKA